MAFRDALLPEFDHEMAVTRRVLERMPFHDASWQPHVKSMSLAALAAHLVDIPGWTAVILTQNQFDMGGMDDMEKTGPTLRAETLPALLAAFDTSTKTARELIAATSDAQFMEPWTLKNRGEEIFTLP
jgi:hypothetical protein